MEFFTYFYEDEIKRFFYQKPQNFNKYANRELLSYGLGATLYMPATRPNIHQEILSKKHEGLTSLVIDLEDAVGDKEVLGAETMLILELLKLDGEINRGYLSFVDLPLMFIRVRSLPCQAGRFCGCGVVRRCTAFCRTPVVRTWVSKDVWKASP
jgi:hypothetical protein